MIARFFPAKIQIGTLYQILNSVSAHLAAKLQLFGTDERVLTDELCDMFYLWGKMTAEEGGKFKFPLDTKVEVTISKFSQNREGKIGADLAIEVQTPRRFKTALFQAKVIDPSSSKLRQSGSAGIDKLREQLVLMRSFLRSEDLDDELAFLLAYVPASYLKANSAAIKTYERLEIIAMRGSSPEDNKSRDDSFGCTTIQIGELICEKDRMRAADIGYDIKDGLKLKDTSLTRLVLGMLACQFGKPHPTRIVPPPPSGGGPVYGPDENFHSPYLPRNIIRIVVGPEQLDEDKWNNIQQALQSWLETLDANMQNL